MLTLPLTTERPGADPVYRIYYDRLLPGGEKRFEHFGSYLDADTAFTTRDYLLEMGFRCLLAVDGGRT